MGNVIRIEYKPSPTAAEFHADDTSFVRGLMGPIGSGKSVACAMELLYRAKLQAPDERGIRPSRFVVVRNTYQMLTTTTLATWKDWFGPIAKVKMGSPIVSSITLPQADGTTVDMETQFLALDRPDDTKKIKSLELTGAWLNEAKELPKAVLDDVSSRVGRFPAKRRAPLTWSGTIMDTNPPDDDHWYYRLAEIVKPEGYRFYKQPGALIRKPDGTYEANPLAENVEHQPIGYSYWMRQVAGKDPEWVKAYLCGEYASVFDGKPVYEHMYSDAMHASPEPLPILRGIPIIIGIDFGLTPAAVFCQLTPDGRFHVLREYCFERGGVRQFVEDVLKPALFSEFNGMSYVAVCDPAGMAGMQTDSDMSCISELRRLGIHAIPAKTNNFMIRRQNVINFLARMVGGTPAFRLDPSCKTLRKGFNGGYKFNRVQIAGEERYRDEPDKNQYSHIHDALQYAAEGGDPTAGAGKTRRRRECKKQKNTMAGLT